MNDIFSALLQVLISDRFFIYLRISIHIIEHMNIVSVADVARMP